MKPNLENLPNKPGCYIFLDKSKKIIYIGKAKNLKKRVQSYFSKKNHDSKTESLLKNIFSMDFLTTNTEVEALLLEDNLIKKNKPKYNIDLKDSKSYAFIELTNEEYPRLIIARTDLTKKRKTTGKLFGPFVSAESRNQAINILNKTFQIRTCNKLPKRKCIRYDLGICSAPCTNIISQKEYLENVKKPEMILKGKDKDLIRNLKQTMKKYSKEFNYEKALLVREQLRSVEYLREKQNVERQKKYNEDIINFLIKDEIVYLMIFNISKGTLYNKQEFVFDHKDNFLEEFLVQYYGEEKIPKLLVLPEKLNSPIKGYLEKKKKSKVEIRIPEKGELKQLLDLVKKNIEIQHFGDLEKLEILQKEINLQDLPGVIECFDVSHLGGTQVVASMVQFRNGKPDKSNYRKFKIRAKDKNDDFAAMQEVVKRRYSRLKKEGLTFPDLIVVDGGLGQLNSSLKALKEIEVKIPIISLAKREEEIYLPGGNIIKLNSKNNGRKLLEAIRNEAHRFAIKYQRERRRKSYFN
ncbi:excinuclease ABC subunit C [archaeon]|jgi:excinuclease ABC subunit C|nr:excinuclease ABC subunit C [archaeon]